MDYTTFLPENKQAVVTSPSQIQSLYQVCQHLADGRKARGKRFELAGILIVLILAKLAGMKSLLAASEWGKDQENLLRTHVMPSWKRMPCANTYSYALAHLESQAVNAHLAAWFVRQTARSQSEREDESHVHLAIDGKVLKSTGEQAYGGEHPQQHVLHLYEAETGIVLQQIPIGTKTNEHGALKPWLTEVICKGRVLTADAAQSYHETPQLIKRAGGDVILIIKDNTPLARADLELFFEDAQADRSTWQSYTQVEKAHGRLEARSIVTSPDLNGLFFKDWGEIGQVFRLERTRTVKGKRSCELRYGLTTLSPSQCSPERLLRYLRAHWNVENRLHWRRDALLGEDHCRVRCLPVMEMLAVLNSAILSLMDIHRVSLVARQLRRFASHPEEALPWLIGDF